MVFALTNDFCHQGISKFTIIYVRVCVNVSWIMICDDWSRCLGVPEPDPSLGPSHACFETGHTPLYRGIARRWTRWFKKSSLSWYFSMDPTIVGKSYSSGHGTLFLRKLQPIIRTSYYRCAFQLLGPEVVTCYTGKGENDLSPSLGIHEIATAWACAKRIK